MTTYSDMVTLLLTFFVMLFSMATIDKHKFEQIAISIKNAFVRQGSGGEMFESNRGKQFINIYDELNSVDQIVSLVNDDLVENNAELADKNDNAVQRIEDIKKELEKAIVEMGLGEYVKIIERKEFLVLRFNSVILFDLSSADIRDSAKGVLKKLGNILNRLDNEIIIQGHTDNLPINTPQFPSNWELSTRRATNVVHFFIDNCGIEPSRLTATGNGEFKPVKPNDTPENRQQNRRIDIVISKLE
ncbi:MAG: flagellar motor protein MotB [Firmicutes bacterium]|nr:flagellar motor protein MotB [Bacillota bacterium]